MNVYTYDLSWPDERRAAARRIIHDHAYGIWRAHRVSPWKGGPLGNSITLDSGQEALSLQDRLLRVFR